MTGKENAPEIRFEGFTDPWEQRKLGELCTISKGHGYSKADIRDAGTPLILYGRLYTQYESRIEDVDTFAVEQEGSLLSKGNEVIVPASGETAEDIAVASSVRRSGIIFGGDLNVVTPVSKLDPDYTALAITYSKAHDDLAKRAQGKSVVHVHGNDIAEVEISYPSESEQKRISTVVLGLDNLITLHQRKYDKLCTVKKSMLDKMFPKPGETEPEIRFEGFTDPWEQRKLGDIAVEVTRVAPESSAPVMMISTPANGFIYQSEHYAFDNTGESLKKYIQLSKGEMAYNHGASKLRPYGSCFVMKEDQARVPFVYHCFRVPNSDPDFASLQLNLDSMQLQLRKLISSGARMDGLLNISYNEYMSLGLTMPSLSEQRQIGRYFGQLDSLITLHQRKLELLRNIKKSLLDRMFV